MALAGVLLMPLGQHQLGTDAAIHHGRRFDTQVDHEGRSCKEGSQRGQINAHASLK
jgi:hypothetical protein